MTDNYGLSKQQILELAEDAIFAKFSHQPMLLPGMVVENDMGYTMIDSGYPSDTFNIVCRSHLDPDYVEQGIQLVKDYFSDVGRPVCWWIGPTSEPHELADVLMTQGFKQDAEDELLAADISQLHIQHQCPRGLEIRQVDDEQGLDDFAQVLASLFDESHAQHYREYYHLVGNHTAVGDEEEPMQYFVGYLEGKPVATASCFIHNDVASFFDCVTLPEYRRRGIGSAMMTIRFQQMLQQGIHWVVLSASKASQGLYERQGFKSYGRFKTFLYDPLA